MQFYKTIALRVFCFNWYYQNCMNTKKLILVTKVPKPQNIGFRNINFFEIGLSSQGVCGTRCCPEIFLFSQNALIGNEYLVHIEKKSSYVKNGPKRPINGVGIFQFFENLRRSCWSHVNFQKLYFLLWIIYWSYLCFV